MVKTGRKRYGTTTCLSFSSAFLAIVLGGDVRAQPSIDAETSPPAPAPSEPVPPNGFERRHRVGLQLGGTGVVQVAYRLRALGPLYLEAGLLGADHGGNVSAGVLVGAPVANRWFPYAGFGAGAMFAFGPKTAKGCDSKTTECPKVDGSGTLVFLHLRAGVGLALGTTRRHLVSLDVGGWRGVWHKDEKDVAGNETRSSGTVTLPMVGLAYFFAF